MRGVLLGLALMLVTARVVVADGKSTARTILEHAIEGEKDPKVLTQALADLDALLAKNAKDAEAHYARGWVLSRSGKNNDEAVAAYDRAFELDNRLPDAAYNAGVVLGRIGNSKEAVIRFERALKIKPSFVDAAFNAGQSYYDLGDYANAAARWETAAKLSPDDFQIAKKLVQAYVALGKPDSVRRARDHVFAMWKSGKDPELGKLKSYIYDQLTVGKYHVYVYEAFEPGELPVYQAKVVLKDKVIGSVTLVLKADRYLVGLDKDGERTIVTDHEWKKQPDYKTWKAIATHTIETRFSN